MQFSSTSLRIMPITPNILRSTFMTCLVCLVIGQKHYSYNKFFLVKKWKKSIENVMGNIWGWHFATSFQKFGFLGYSSCRRTGFLQMNNQMPKVHCSLCSCKHQGHKVDSLLGKKFILFSFFFCSEGAR
jgi:hypothetical protein